MTAPAPHVDREVRFVADEAALALLLRDLESTETVGVDTEANSFHAYRERICLIQITTPAGDWIVDPLAVDAGALAELFASRDREVVFHAAEFDIACLKRCYGFRFGALFDTQVAAMLLGMGQVGYSALVEELFGVRLPKNQQRSDWGRRPLTSKQISYAANDSRYLIGIRDRLRPMLEERGLLKEAEAVFSRMVAVEPRERVFDEEGFYKLKGYRELDATGRAVARALFLARERRADRIDKPPFRVFGNDVLLTLASRRPADADALSKIKGLPQSTVERFGSGILEAVRQGSTDDDPPPARRRRKTPPRGRRGGSAEGDEETAADARFERLRGWRNELARARGVEGQIIVRNEVLREIAREMPGSLAELRGLPGLDDYAVRAYGGAIIDALAGGSTGGER